MPNLRRTPSCEGRICLLEIRKGEKTGFGGMRPKRSHPFSARHKIFINATPFEAIYAKPVTLGFYQLTTCLLH